MKLSWSHKLFLWVNQKVGNYPALDKFMYFCAQWLVFILGSVFFAWILYEDAGLGSALVASSCFLAYMISYGIGYLWRHSRPEREFPMIKTLIKPLQSWKSFPSDHAICVTLLVLFVVFFSAPVSLIIGICFGAVLVVIARVYAGIHYPRDIVGGIAVATVSFLFVMYLFFNSISALVN